jgi:hypothetical protein
MVAIPSIPLLGTPKIVIKRTFWMFFVSLIVAAVPAALLKDALSKLLSNTVSLPASELIMWFGGYLISFSFVVILYEFIKTGNLKWSVPKVKRMTLAWLRTILITIPALVSLVIIFLTGVLLFLFIPPYIPVLIVLFSALALIALIPLSIVLQWFWYEKGA